MKERNFSATFSVDNSPSEVFRAVNNVTDWWTKSLQGKSAALNDEFTVRFADIHYSKQKLVEVVPDKKITWLITESELTFTKDKSEWTDTRIVFEIGADGTKTTLTFTHEGLIHDLECYNACSGAWSDYVNSLKKLIETGKGNPHEE